MKRIGYCKNTTVNTICFLLICFYIDLQLFKTAFENTENLHFLMFPDFTMKQTVAIVYFILAANNIT